MFSLHRWLHWRQRWTLHSEYGQPLTISCGRCVHLSKINYVVYYNCIELGDLVSQIDSRAFADNNQLWQIIVSNWDATFAQDALENTPAILVLEHEPTESNFAFPYALNQ